MQTVTLIFNLVIWFLFETYRLVMMIICTILFSNPTMHNKVMGTTRTLKSTHKVLVRTVTLTFDPATLFLLETHRYVIMMICANYFQIPSCTATLWPDTLLKHTNTQRGGGVTLYALPPFHGGA